MDTACFFMIRNGQFFAFIFVVTVCSFLVNSNAFTYKEVYRLEQRDKIHKVIWSHCLVNHDVEGSEEY